MIVQKRKFVMFVIILKRNSVLMRTRQKFSFLNFSKSALIPLFNPNIADKTRKNRIFYDCR